jgi:hypothetical protein
MTFGGIDLTALRFSVNLACMKPPFIKSATDNREWFKVTI